jgi:hypothetical protein
VLLYVVLGIVAAFILLCGGCLAVVAGMDTSDDDSGKDDSSETNESDKPKAPKGSTDDEGEPSEEASEESEEPEPEPEAKWETVASLEGNTSKAGPDFPLHGCEARLKYTVDGGASIIVAFYVLESGTQLMQDGGFPVATPTESGASETTLRLDEGDYFIQVEAANADWTAAVQEKC